jgi:hypothetical protein
MLCEFFFLVESIYGTFSSYNDQEVEDWVQRIFLILGVSIKLATKGLFFLSFCSIPSPTLGIHFLKFSFSSILFGPLPRLPFIFSWFCLQLFYCFIFLSHQFASFLCPIPPRPQPPLSNLESFLDLQPLLWTLIVLLYPPLFSPPPPSPTFCCWLGNGRLLQPC